MAYLLKKHPLPAFFVLGFAFTWIGSLAYYYAIPKGGPVLPPSLAFPGAIVWYYGPFLAAVIVTRVSSGRGSIGWLLKRFLIWRVGWAWYAFTVFYPFALHLAVVGLDRLLGGPAPRFFQAEGVPAGNVWLTLAGLALLHFFLRGIGEETGWRGFALPRMQTRWSAFSASLVLGALWALWHFHPANFSALLSSTAIFFCLNVIGTTIIYTWVYNHTHGSLLVAALFHMTLNVAEYVIPVGIAQASLSRNLLQILAIWIVVAVLVLRYGPEQGKERLQLPSVQD